MHVLSSPALVGHDLAIVIVTYNSARDLGGCLGSVLEAGGELDLHVVVADSGSTDDTTEVARRFPVTYLPGGDDGFGRACNRGVALEAVRESRYVLFLNPDTAIQQGSLGELLAECDRRGDHRLFTVRQVDTDGTLVHSLRRFPSVESYVAEALPVGRMRSRRERIVEPAVYARESECDWALGSFLLLPKEAIAQLGGFDERFFLYSEEVDLCRRARAGGWRVTYLPCLTIVHRRRIRDPRRARHNARAKLIYAEKWGGRREQRLTRAVLLVHYGRVAVRARSPAQRRGALAALWAVLSYRSLGPARRATRRGLQAQTT